MNLFTTITSERGKPVSKSGNEHLHVDIVDKYRQAIATIDIRVHDNGTATVNWDNFISNVHTTSTYKT